MTKHANNLFRIQGHFDYNPELLNTLDVAKFRNDN